MSSLLQTPPNVTFALRFSEPEKRTEKEDPRDKKRPRRDYLRFHIDVVNTKDDAPVFRLHQCRVVAGEVLLPSRKGTHKNFPIGEVLPGFEKIAERLLEQWRQYYPEICTKPPTPEQQAQIDEVYILPL